MEPPTPGWYFDPKSPGGRRYWDGHAWVDVDAVVDGSPDHSPVTSAPRLIAQRRSEEYDDAPVEVAFEAPVEVRDEIAGETDVEHRTD
jgi:hypothetical protein